MPPPNFSTSIFARAVSAESASLLSSSRLSHKHSSWRIVRAVLPSCLSQTTSMVFIKSSPTRPPFCFALRIAFSQFHHAWSDSLSVTVHHLLPPYVHSGVLLGAAAWALAALLVPWVIRGVSIVADLVRVALWSVATVAATAVAVTVIRGTATAALHGSHRLPTTSAEVLGAIAGGVILLVWSVVHSRLPTPSFAGSTDRAP